MKIFVVPGVLFMSLVMFAGCSVAAPPGCGKHAVYGTTDENGRKVELVLDSAAIQRAPSWGPGKGEPPLSISKASQLALAWAKARYKRYDSVEISEIVLTRYSCSSLRGRWYYRFEFTPIMDGNRVIGMGNFAAVLMDGSVVGPSKPK